MEEAIFEAESHLTQAPDRLGELADGAVRRELAPLALASARSGGCHGAELLGLD